MKMRSRAVFVAAALIALIPATALAERTYNAEKSVTHDCAKDPEVVIQGGGGTYALAGPCTKVVLQGSGTTLKAESIVKLAITGSKHVVEVDAVDKISVTGSDNSVTYKRGVNGKPKAASIGGNNKLNQVK